MAEIDARVDQAESATHRGTGAPRPVSGMRRSRLPAWVRDRWLLATVMSLMLASPQLEAQQLLDRIVATVDGVAVTLTDMRMAIGLRLIAATGDADPAAVAQMVDRQLVLAEVIRFPPPEPPAEAVEAELTKLRAAAGSALPELMRTTGLEEARLRELARDVVRGDSYITQRFGLSAQVSDDEAEQYVAVNQAVFTRNGVRMPLDEALPLARQRLAAERRQAAVDRWLQDLRVRARIVIPRGR